MALSVEMVAEEAMNLPASGRALLRKKLLASLAGEINPTMKHAHLDDVRERWVEAIKKAPVPRY